MVACPGVCMCWVWVLLAMATSPFVKPSGTEFPVCTSACTLRPTTQAAWAGSQLTPGMVTSSQPLVLPTARTGMSRSGLAHDGRAGA